MTSGRSTRKGEQTPAAELPIARVCVDVPLSHLDRPFDYLVSDRFDAEAVPGCRVRVRFAGQLVDGFLLDRVAESDHDRKLAYLHAVVSPEPVLSAESAALCRAVADRYGGTLIDVLRLAVPPRHARVERADPAPAPAPPTAPDTAAWERYPRGASYVAALTAGRTAHAVWQPLPGEDWPARLAELATAVASTGRSAVLVVPDYRDVARLAEACTRLAGEETVAALSAGLGPAARYRRWLAVRRGAARIVVGTRATMFAPSADPGLLVVWDDGDDLHAEPRSPYPHVRDVLIQRGRLTSASVLVAGYARTAEAQLLVEAGWAHGIIADRATVRAVAPRVVSVGEHDGQLARDSAARTARLPSIAFDAVRDAVAADRPVLVQVPRRGYVPTLACQQCRAPARCRRCAGPLSLPGGGPDGQGGPPSCRWCGVADPAYRCGTCGSPRLRAAVVGAGRTAEELGRAFPGVPVRTSGGSEVLAGVPGGASLVVCTPGAEPVADGGYGAALLLDGWALLGRADLRAAEETLRRWMLAAAMVRPASDGGRVVVLAESSLVTVQALVRWDPVWHADLELAGRTELAFPPAVRMASIEGGAAAVAGMLAELRLPDDAEVLGPVPLGEAPAPGAEERERALVRVPRGHGRDLAAALAAAQAVRSARKEPDVVRTQLDPLVVV